MSRIRVRRDEDGDERRVRFDVDAVERFAGRGNVPPKASEVPEPGQMVDGGAVDEIGDDEQKDTLCERGSPVIASDPLGKNDQNVADGKQGGSERDGEADDGDSQLAPDKPRVRRRYSGIQQALDQFPLRLLK